MDALLQVHGAKRVFPIPEGLRELSSDIIREVLRHQPECIHAFIAEYLETMLLLREKARESMVVVSDVFRQGYFLEELYRLKRVTMEMANEYATYIQAAWRGYVVRKKIRLYLQKKQKIQEKREEKEAMAINEYLESVGLTYDEATRAACIIQSAYKRSKQDKLVTTEDREVPFGQRVRENDRVSGRYDRWDKKDWGDFFQLDSEGEIMWDWPRTGQLLRIARKALRPDMDIVKFFAMRDFEGTEQYSYLREQQEGQYARGFPFGFLIPVERTSLREDSAEVEFVDAENNAKMGNYTYVYERTIERDELNHFKTVLEHQTMYSEKQLDEEYFGEFGCDSSLVFPRVLIQIQKDFLLESDDEIRFLNEAIIKDVDLDIYTFRAENSDKSLKIINHVQKCGTIEEAMKDAANLQEYKSGSIGRILLVEDFNNPKYIQKVIIEPETESGIYENRDMDEYEYVFVLRDYQWKTRRPKPENPIRIPLTRFQGYRQDFTGSKLLKDKTYILGPMLHSPDGKPLMHTSRFWDEIGPKLWYQLLCRIATEKIRRVEQGEPAVVPEEEKSEEEQEEEEKEGEKWPESIEIEGEKDKETTDEVISQAEEKDKSDKELEEVEVPDQIFPGETDKATTPQKEVETEEITASQPAAEESEAEKSEETELLREETQEEPAQAEANEKSE